MWMYKQAFVTSQLSKLLLCTYAEGFTIGFTVKSETSSVMQVFSVYNGEEVNLFCCCK